MQQIWVRIGLVGQVGRFRAVDGRRYARGAEVVCRTSRGIEIGEILNNVQQLAQGWDGDVIRSMTAEDRMLWERLRRHQAEAFAACQGMLAERNVGAVLMDVEPLLDGSSLFFYFLGPPDDAVAAITAELAETYDSTAQIRRFSDVLIHGCGPACGTEAGDGCASGGCGSCETSCAVSQWAQGRTGAER